MRVAVSSARSPASPVTTGGAARADAVEEGVDLGLEGVPVLEALLLDADRQGSARLARRGACGSASGSSAAGRGTGRRRPRRCAACARSSGSRARRWHWRRSRWRSGCARWRCRSRPRTPACRSHRCWRSAHPTIVCTISMSWIIRSSTTFTSVPRSRYGARRWHSMKRGDCRYGSAARIAALKRSRCPTCRMRPARAASGDQFARLARRSR